MHTSKFTKDTKETYLFFYYCPLSLSATTVNNTKLGTTYTLHIIILESNNEDPAAERDQTKWKHSSGVYEPSRFQRLFPIMFTFLTKAWRRGRIGRYPQLQPLTLEKVYSSHWKQQQRCITGNIVGKHIRWCFLARQLSLRCDELGSPTIVMIVDRDDLQSRRKLFCDQRTSIVGYS